MSAPSRQKLTLLPAGFRFSAVAAGIKTSGKLDLALVEASPGTTAAALFTRNRVVAAPLQIGRAHLAKTGGRVHAVIINSGNANCATGKAGLQACKRVCEEAARFLRIKVEEVFPSSTGIIGIPLPTGKIIASLPELIARREASNRGLDQFSQAILTTDTRRKLAFATFPSGKSQVSLLGIAKGSGMIHPQLATMLVYLFTDISATPGELKRLLRDACKPSFNCISVDGDTSTNDTVLLLASGQSGVRLKDDGMAKKFSAALLTVCQSLAEQIVSDGEGVQHVIRLLIEQASNREEAGKVARAVAHSLLVKTAWAGADPNWGRILAAVGACGIALDPGGVNIYIGKQMVCAGGQSVAFDEKRAHAALAKPRCDIRIRLGRGRAATTFLTSDLTAEYIRINADYST